MTGGLPRRLRRWREAGLLDPSQEAAILAFERDHRHGLFARRVTGVALFAILLGVLSLVAANWQDLSIFMRLGLHFAVNAAVAVLMVRTSGETHPYRRDVFVCALFGLTLTMIALIAQSFQLHGELGETLLFWLAITTPFVIYWGRTLAAANVWIAALCVTIVVNIVDFTLFRFGLLLSVSLIGVNLPPLFFYVSQWRRLMAAKPDFAAAAAHQAVVLPMICASTVLLLQPSIGGGFILQSVDDIALYLAAIAAMVLLHRTVLFRIIRDEAVFPLRNYLVVSSAACLVALLLPATSFASALSVVAYWLYVAWFASRHDAPRLFDVCIWLIVLRLFIGYLEIFGSLMLQGLGLIVSGVVVIALIKLTPRLTAIARKAAAR